MKRSGLVLLVVLATAGFAYAGEAESNGNALSAGSAAAMHPASNEHAAIAGSASDPLPPKLQSALSKSLARDAHTASPRARVWDEQKLVAAGGGMGHSFGNAVFVSGKTALIGAPSSSNRASGDGAVYVFTETDGVWREQQKLLASDGAAGDMFGTAIAMHGNTAIIGAWGGMFGQFGVGDPAFDGALNPANVVAGTSTAGAAYVFIRSNGVWTQTAKLVADVSVEGEFFGLSVAISDTAAMVGAFRASVDPDQPEQGAVYVFTKSGETWQQTQKLIANDGRADDSFGWSIALSGSQALIGANQATLYRNAMGQGVVYAFTEAGGQWTQTQKLSARDGERADFFGTSVALSGTTALIGSMNGGMHGGIGNGAAYVFNYSNGTWSERQKLIAQNGDMLDAFGISVALSDSTAVVGAYYARVGMNTQQGAAFVFTESDGRWIETRRLVASDGGVHDKMGFSVALDGDTAVVGAQTVTVNGSLFQGAAYVYSAHDAPAASVTPAALHLHVAPDEVGSATLNIANQGDEPLDYAIDEAHGRRIALDVRSASRPAPGSGRIAAAPVAVLAPLEAHRIAGPRAAAPWWGLGADLSFILDDGSYGESWTVSIGYDELAGIWLNRFSPPLGTGAFSVDSISIMWPQSTYGSLIGRRVNLLAYHDADGDGDPRNAVRLGGDHLVTIEKLDHFTDYGVDFRVPGDGDLYIGFESTYARGGSWPKLYPAALDISSPAQERSWFAGSSRGTPDPDRLDAHDIIGYLESFTASGNWLIRATGTDAENDCVAPSQVPWLSLSPASGSVEAGATKAVAVTADASRLALGEYTAVLCIGSNDPLNRLLRVPVSLSVSAADTIFRDGFDGRP